MAKESQSEPAQKAAEFTTMGMRRIEEFTKVQSELLDKVQDTNRLWVERLQSETNLAAEFVTRLSAARSISDAMTACQQWTGRRFELMTEDGKRMLADAQKFMDASSRLLSNGWLSDHPGITPLV